MIEDKLHEASVKSINAGKYNTVNVPPDMLADLADIMHWAREWCKQDSLMRGEDGKAYRYHSDKAWEAQTNVRRALARLDEQHADR